LTRAADFVTISGAMPMQTKTLVVGGDGVASAAIKEAAEILASGGLVAFPTETVYGVGANAGDAAAVERLRALKERPEGKPFSVHIADRAELAGLVNPVPVIAQKLMDKFWPGPLTIVFGRSDDAAGVRLPSHEIAAAFLRACGVPVVAPSANLAGEAPAVSADEVRAALGGRVDAVLAGGAAPLGQPSTVVRVWRTGWGVLREGAVPSAEVERALRRNIVFVCTGNSCRSPIAAALCREALAKHLRVEESDLEAMGYEVVSAGTATAGGGRASESALAAAADAGLDISGHRSQRLTAEMLERADRVYAMNKHHADAARDVCPGAAGKIELLDPDGGTVEDPIGLPLESFRGVVQNMRRCVERRVTEL